MTKETGSGEKRQLGVKISAAAYSVLEGRARDRGLSPTTLARWLLLDRV